MREKVQSRYLERGMREKERRWTKDLRARRRRRAEVPPLRPADRLPYPRAPSLFPLQASPPSPRCLPRTVLRLPNSLLAHRHPRLLARAVRDSFRDDEGSSPVDFGQSRCAMPRIVGEDRVRCKGGRAAVEMGAVELSALAGEVDRKSFSGVPILGRLRKLMEIEGSHQLVGCWRSVPGN